MHEKPRMMPTAYFLIMLILSVGLHFIFPLMKIIHFPYNLTGIILLFLGIYLNIWTDILLKKNETTVKPHKKPSCLICKGPFLISRHPMYLGMLLILLGVNVIQGTLLPFIIPIIFVIYMESIFIPMEEKILEDEFKEKYLQYRENVRRWI